MNGGRNFGVSDYFEKNKKNTFLELLDLIKAPEQLPEYSHQKRFKSMA